MTNFDRMIQLATEVFDAHNDPEQLDVNESVIEQLHQLHPACVSEFIEGDGPIIWLILIPTTEKLMHEFIEEIISESELLNQTPLHIKYDALYLCSVMVLEEFRRKGLAKKIALEAIKKIRFDHPIKKIFTWNFSKEGSLLAESISREESLPLFNRERKS
jgi:GNAT superfamily N-acetyltransferase